MTTRDSEKNLYIADKHQERLDIFVARVTEETRSRIQKHIKNGDVLVNNKPEKVNYRLATGDKVSITIHPPISMDVQPENIPLDIIYQDEDIAIINKEQGMVVHPAPGNYTGTLVSALLFSLKDLSGIGGAIRPGIVHRIDKMTSGLLVIAKNDKAHLALCNQLENHDIKRKYLAIVCGGLKEEKGSISKPIGRHKTDRKRMAVIQGGKEATTHWKALCPMGKYTLIEAELTTGRTHQIRVHMAHIGHPVAGDEVYGSKKPGLGLNGQALHAYMLTLTHPGTGKKLSFYAPPPGYFINALYKAGWDGNVCWETNY